MIAFLFAFYGRENLGGEHFVRRCSWILCNCLIIKEMQRI